MGLSSTDVIVWVAAFFSRCSGRPVFPAINGVQVSSRMVTTGAQLRDAGIAWLKTGDTTLYKIL